jgi:D-alanine-D-alanine ligase
MTSYRALLDTMGIPYVGNTPDVMALGADKAKAKAVVGAAGVAVPSGEVLRRGDRPTLRPPVVVKPTDADNSFGVTLVHDHADYDRALDDAFAHSDTAIVEDYIALGREVRCGVLARGGELVCLPLEEYNVETAARPIRGYADKIPRASRGSSKQVSIAPSPARASSPRWPQPPQSRSTSSSGPRSKRPRRRGEQPVRQFRWPAAAGRPAGRAGQP